MAMNNVKQIFQNKFTNLGGKLKLDKNDEHLNFDLPPYTDALYQTAKINKDICSDLYKKMANACVINYNLSDDKKAKKNPWESLSSAVVESEKKVTDDILTKEIFSVSIKTFDDLSYNAKDFEKNISSNVIKYFQELSEDNSLSNLKKAVTVLTKDMKSNSEKVQNLQDQLNIQNSESSYRKSMDISNVGSAENKLVNAQIAEENSEKELDTKKDLLLSKLFCSQVENLAMADKMMEFFKQHLEYYIECKNILTKCIPELQNIIDTNRKKHVFHLSLDEHCNSSNRKLSYVLQTCIEELDNEETLQEEGIFRISGSKNKLDLLKNALNVMRADEYIIKSCDSAVFAGVLKQYLRELPIPLMTFVLYDKWCEVGNKIKQNDIEGAKSLTKSCLSQMPPCYYDNLKYLLEFLKKISENESFNKMNASNLALVLGPNLIRNKSANDNDDSDASRVMMLGSPGPGVLDFMITFFYDIYPDVPVYIAKSKMQGKVLQVKNSDKELDKAINLKVTKHNADTDSVSSVETFSEDPSKDLTIIRPKLPRKPPAPLPPVAKMPVPEIEIDNISEKETNENRPKVKKRTTILEKSFSEKASSELFPGDKEIKRVPSVGSNTKTSGTTPIIPNKKPFIPTTPVETVEKTRVKIESIPPKRPNNPPPPIPSFDKLKESLDQKNLETPSCKSEIRKPSVSNDSTQKSFELDVGMSKDAIKGHHYSNSDTNRQSTLF